MFSKKALIELAKSFGRFIWFTLIGGVVTFLIALAASQDLLSSTWTFADVTLPVGVYIAAIITFVVKGLDRYINQNKKIDSNGLALPFLQK